MGEARTARSLLRLGTADGQQQSPEVGRLEPVEGDEPPSATRSTLRRRLVVSDVLTVAAAWSLAPFVPWASMTEVPGRWWVAVPLLTGLTVLLLRMAGLHRARVCSVRSNEVLRIGYVCGAIALSGQIAPLQAQDPAVPATLLVGASVVFVGLVASRAIYRNWLLAKRATGHLLRTVAIIGADDGGEPARLPPRGPPGGRVQRRSGTSGPPQGTPPTWPGRCSARRSKPPRCSATSASTARSSSLALCSRRSARRCWRRSPPPRSTCTWPPGCQGIDSRRLRSLPLGHEPLLYLEPAGPQRALVPAPQAGASTSSGPASPCCWRRRCTRWRRSPSRSRTAVPVLFRQERAGMGNRTFGLFKLRSMTVDAEAQLADLMAQNQRDGGPLFKLDHDPRVTKVGAVLRATSFDEIPQLFNVLRGEMSLVGPRPALPDEVAVFDEELLVRQQVRPGVTGLWQVEARDNPSFSAYRYLDVFYVENQSLALDLTILIGTVRAVVGSCLRAVRRPTAPAPRAEADPSLAASALAEA